VIGELEGRTVLAMQGRSHFYEGYPMSLVTLPVRVMRLLGIDTLIVTNAAGGLNPSFHAGDIMVIEDHINIVGMAGNSPLRGPNLGEFGPRFTINTRAYNPTLRWLAHRVAQEKGITLREGVYVALAGPAFETPAEVRMLRAWGGDSVGMSTAHEVMVAYHAGMRVLGFSSITNLSLDSTEARDEVSHEEVLRLGREIVPSWPPFCAACWPSYRSTTRQKWKTSPKHDQPGVFRREHRDRPVHHRRGRYSVDDVPLPARPARAGRGAV